MNPKDAINSLPSVSIVIPTFNSERTIRECISSITKQDYPKELIEIIVPDGGSTDSTLQIVSQLSDARIVTNKLRTGEAGKAVGVSCAKNEIVALVDSDNVLDDPSWLRKMTHPFSDPDIVASEPLYFSHRKTDPLVSRYCALIGANDPLTVYIGNHDRYCFFKERWTEIPLPQKDYGDYLAVEVRGRVLPTFGANGFLVLRNLVQQTGRRPFLFDIDFVHDLAGERAFHIAKVKIGITHLFAPNVGFYIRKTLRRIRDYWFYSGRGTRTYPWQDYPRAKLLKFVLFSLTVIPTLRDARRGCAVLPDRAWLFHPFGCLLVLFVYATFLMTAPGTAWKRLVAS